MRLAGTSDGGWVAVDLRHVADAISTLRSSPTAQRLREEREHEHRARQTALAAR